MWKEDGNMLKYKAEYENNLPKTKISKGKDWGQPCPEGPLG